MSNIWNQSKGLGIVIGGAIVFSGNSTIAQINKDGNLPNNFGITAQDKTNDIQNDFSEIPKNSEVDAALVVSENEGVLKKNSIDFHSSTDLNEIEFNDAVGDNESQKYSRVTPGQHTKQKGCYLNDKGKMICP